LYEKGETGRITIDSICDSAKIHRSTFYYHFKSVDAILESIKDRQMSLLKELFESTGGKDVDFKAFIPAFQELFNENERYLVPLVIEYGDKEFSFRYRSYLEDMMFEHLKISYSQRDDRTAGVLEVVISGMVNMFLTSLATHTVTLRDSDLLSHGMINVGLRSVLRDNFGIHIGFTTMSPRHRWAGITSRSWARRPSVSHGGIRRRR
jgi:AcrR family transcriptional regulator